MNSVAQSSEQVLVCDCTKLNVIRLVQMRLWRRNSSGPFGIIRQQQQSFAGHVQPPDGRNPRKSRRKITVNRLAALFVRRRGDHAARFVECKINSFALRERGAIHFDPVFSEVYWSFRIAAQRAVQFHTPRTNQLGCFGARANAELGERPSKTGASYFVGSGGGRSAGTIPHGLSFSWARAQLPSFQDASLRRNARPARRGLHPACS